LGKRGCSIERVNALHRRQRARGGEHVVFVRIGAVAGLRKKRRGLDTLHEHGDLANGVVLVQRRVAHIAVTRAREQDHDAFDAIRQAHRNALAALQSRVVQIRGKGVDPLRQSAPREALATVSQRIRVGPYFRVMREEAVQRVLAPGAFGVIALGDPRIVQRQYRAHA
jgi:hypothetical protein